MKFHFPIPKLKLSSSRKARSKALTLSVIVGVFTFAMATIGGKIVTGKVSSIVVASTDLEAGQVLSDKNLNDAGKVSGILPTDVMTSKSEAVGLTLAYPVKAGQPIVKGLISKAPQRNGLYPGEVGVWVSVTLTTSGLAKPGDLVDVYLSTTSDQWGKVEAPQKVSSLQGVRVVSVVNNSAQQVKVDASNPNGNVPAAVELAIPKSQAGEFSQIAAGKVSLMLDPFATPLSNLSENNPSVIQTPSAGLPNNPPVNVPNGSYQHPQTSQALNTPLSSPTQPPMTPAPNQENSQQSSAAQNTTTPSNEPASTSPTTSQNQNQTSTPYIESNTQSGNYTPPVYNPASSN